MTTTHEQEQSPRRCRILVAEDSPTQAHYLARLLAAEPSWQVDLAPDGAAALARIRGAAPDLLISDVAMPGMDGYTLCRAVKDDPHLSTLPVLLLTSLASLHDIVRGLEAGADGFMRKPFDPDQLRERVRRLLHGADGGGGRERPLEFMADERRRIYELLVATHEQALRLNAELDAQRAGLARACDSLALLGSVAGALNEAASEDAVAQAVLDQVLRLPSLTGARLAACDTDGAPRTLAARGTLAADAGESGDILLALEAGGRRLGHLQLHTGGAGLGEGEADLLASVAQQVALALERARLYARAEALVVARTEALRSERNRLSAVVETSGALVLLTDPQGRILMFNRACEEALGWRAEDAVGRYGWEVVRGADDPDLARRLFAELALSTQPLQAQGEWRRPDGTVRCIIWTSTLIRDAGGAVEYALGTGVDVTELRGAEARLRYASDFDTLTGLPNRALLHERLRPLTEAARSGGGLAGLMLLRLGRMPRIRAALGPGAEQALLQQVATRLRDAAGTDVVARFSEGAFALAALRPGSDEAAANELAALARRVLAAVGAPYALERDEFHLDPCLGIAVCPTDGSAFEVLARGAETALRQAMEAGGQRYAFYRPELNRDVDDHFRLESALHRALERGEFELHYQPQFAVGSRQLVSAEALLRWRHPERGLVAPSTFIPLAEESGLILAIGEWALRETCAQLRAWQHAGLAVVPIAVNLSAYQFSGQIVGTVRRILDEYGIDPALLELELTETASMADAGKSCELLVQLKAMGIRLAIDDFGTGYSNLNYLKRFPVDKLKLDQSFVRDILDDGDDLAISRAVIAMAHGLRLTVVAEGVETAGQLELLAALGCELAQGFLLGRAVPAEAFAALLATAGPAEAPLQVPT